MVYALTRNIHCLAQMAALCWAIGPLAVSAESPGVRPVAFHRIQVVDTETSRGIPAVELRTTDFRIFYTDSAGMIAFFEPDLMGTKTWFTLTSFGYVFSPDALGLHGTTVEIEPGGSTVLKMERTNVAQRLYRITGSGIYRDSMLLGDAVPPTQDASETPVTGMDSAQSVVYRGKLYWFWGDTAMSRDFVGNFRTTGATSALPGSGGLDPNTGISLTFFRDGAGVRPMFDDPHQPIWAGGPRVVRDPDGEEHLFIGYVKIRGAMEGLEEVGIAKFDDKDRRLKIVLPFTNESPLLPNEMVLRHTVGGEDYFYFSRSWANKRCPAELDAMTDLATLEVFTCVKEGVRFTGKAEELDRDDAGNLRWAWRKNTSAVDEETLARMLGEKLISADEAPIAHRDVNTTETVVHHGGTICYNPYRKRWTSIYNQISGSASYLGEIWYAEGDTPLGPWVYSQKIVSHRLADPGAGMVTFTKKTPQTYSFYNPWQHPEFMKNGGRYVFFEGTYTAAFSESTFFTPGYNYNQIMYGLDLDDPRLFMPLPVYRVEGNVPVYRTKHHIPPKSNHIALAFFACDRQREGTVPVYEIWEEGSPGARLTVVPPASEGKAAKTEVAFYALDAALQPPENSPTANLFEFVSIQGDRVYTTDAEFRMEGYQRSRKAVCRVWPNPIRFDPLSWEYAAR